MFFELLFVAMALFLRSGLCVTGSSEMGLEKKELMVAGPSDVLVCKKERKGSQVVLSEQISSERWRPKGHSHLSIHVSFFFVLRSVI